MIDLNSIVDNLECDDYLEYIDDLESFDEWVSEWDEDVVDITDEELNSEWSTRSMKYIDGGWERIDGDSE